MATKHSIAMTRIVEEAGRCELCGSRRGLEAHHIIPTVCGGDDRKENLICVCKSCHAKLTPTGILTSAGIKNRKRINNLILLKNDLICFIWKRTQDIVDEGARPLTAFYEAMDDVENFSIKPYIL